MFIPLKITLNTFNSINCISYMYQSCSDHYRSYIWSIQVIYLIKTFLNKEADVCTYIVLHKDVLCNHVTFTYACSDDQRLGTCDLITLVMVVTHSVLTLRLMTTSPLKTANTTPSSSGEARYRRWTRHCWRTSASSNERKPSLMSQTARMRWKPDEVCSCVCGYWYGLWVDQHVGITEL